MLHRNAATVNGQWVTSIQIFIFRSRCSLPPSRHCLLKPTSLPWERLATQQHDVMVMTGSVTAVIKASPGISAMKGERHYPLWAAPPAQWLAESDPAAAGRGPESAPPSPSGPPGMFVLLGDCSVQGNLTCLFPRHLLDLAARERPALLTHSLKFFRFFSGGEGLSRTKQPGCREMSSCICGSSVQEKKRRQTNTGRETTLVWKGCWGMKEPSFCSWSHHWFSFLCVF